MLRRESSVLQSDAPKRCTYSACEGRFHATDRLRRLLPLQTLPKLPRRYLLTKRGFLVVVMFLHSFGLGIVPTARQDLVSELESPSPQTIDFSTVRLFLKNLPRVFKVSPVTLRASALLSIFSASFSIRVCFE